MEKGRNNGTRCGISVNSFEFAINLDICASSVKVNRSIEAEVRVLKQVNEIRRKGRAGSTGCQEVHLRTHRRRKTSKTTVSSSSSSFISCAGGSAPPQARICFHLLLTTTTAAAAPLSAASHKVSAMGTEGGKREGVIALFDVDGTLTPARKEASVEMLQFLQDLRKVVTVGVVGGSDLAKISEQLGKNTIYDYDYVFSENGLVAHKAGKLIGNQSMKLHLGEEKLKKFINFVLHYIADLDIPIKRGTFVEFRMGMLNVSPIGRNCSYEEREEFEKDDKVHNVRSKFVEILKEKFADYNLTYSIGGQISFDVFPKGWDKTFCLGFVEKEFSEIHFFGDKTYKGGNDHEIYESEKTIGHTVTSPEDTLNQCTKLFL